MPSSRQSEHLAVNLPAVKGRIQRFRWGDPPLFPKQYVWLIYFLHHYSFMQGSQLYEARTSKALLTTHNTEQPVAFRTEAMLEPGTCFNSAVLQPREVASSTDASPQLDNFVLCSCGSRTFPDERLAMWQAPCSTRGVSGSMWTPSIEG